MSKRFLPLCLLVAACAHPPGPNDVTEITGTEGLALAADGTLYYSQSKAIGRWRPGEAPEPAFAPLGERFGTVWGLALDGQRLYVGSSTAAEIVTLDLSADQPTAMTFVSDAGQPNGLALGPDRALYYSDFRGGHIYCVAQDGTRTQVTATSVARPNGLVVSQGTLSVLSYGDGTLLELTRGSDGIEESRRVVARNLGSPDGVLVLGDGAALVSDYSGGRLLRVELESGSVTTLRDRLNSPANIIFGRTANEVFIASSGALATAQP